MNPILWCIKSFLYGGKLGNLMSFAMLIFFIIHSSLFFIEMSQISHSENHVSIEMTNNLSDKKYFNQEEILLSCLFWKFKRDC